MLGFGGKNKKTNIMNYETITIRGIDFEVGFNYTPGEPEVRYYSDGSGYPGSAPELEILTIDHNGTDFSEFFEDDEEIDEALWNRIEESNRNA